MAFLLSILGELCQALLAALIPAVEARLAQPTTTIEDSQPDPALQQRLLNAIEHSESKPA